MWPRKSIDVSGGLLWRYETDAYIKNVNFPSFYDLVWSAYRKHLRVGAFSTVSEIGIQRYQ